MEAPHKLIALFLVVGLAFQYVGFLQGLVPFGLGPWVSGALYAVSAIWLFFGGY